MEEDGSLQGLLLRKVETYPKFLLGSPEVVTGKTALSPCNIFKSSCVAMKQHCETEA